MFRITTGWVLITLLVFWALPAPGAEPTVTQQVARLKAGRKIKVQLNNGETLKGRLVSTTAGQLTLEPRTAPRTARVIRFDEARSVKPDGLTTGEKWAIFGVVWVAVGIISKLTI